MIKRRRFPKIFPGWWIVVTGSFMNFWVMGYTVFGFSALLKPIASDLGFSRAEASVPASIGRLEGGFEGLVTGYISDRFGPRWIILVGILVFGLGLILMNFVNSLWAYYLVWGVIITTGANAASGLAINTAIANWFVKKRGLAISIKWMISAAFLLPFITWLITTRGWRTACVVGGLVMLVVGLPLTWFFLKQHRPEHYGLLPDGVTVKEELKEDSGQMIKKGVDYAAEVEEVEFTLRQAMRTPAYWLLIASHLGPSMSTVALAIHFIPLFTDIGMSPTKAAATVAIAGLFSPVSRFAAGLLADRLKKQHLRFLLGGAYLLWAGGITLFRLNQTIAMVYPFLILHFISLAVNLIAPSLIGARYFGRKAFGSIQGTSAIATMPIGIVAPIYLGWIYDTTGSYTTALTLIAVLLTVSAVFMFLALPPKPPAQITDIRKIV